MNRRKKTSGGQTVVMVTLALFAMCGMLGLAVDLGWSFFTQKAAQAAADGAALGAVQAAYKANGGGLGILTCSTKSNCYSTPTSCAGITGDNVANGCQYAIANDFNYKTDAKTKVTMQSNVCPSVPCPTANLPPTVSPNITNIKYWVTARAVRTVPQLFSSMLGNTQGVVAAIATAAIAGSILPGSFYGLNQVGDCVTGNAGTSLGGNSICGVDVSVLGADGATCLNQDGSSAGVTAKLCAPAGMYLASQCHGVPQAGCGSGSSSASGSNYSGQTQGGVHVWAQAGTNINGSGTVNDPSMWLPSAPVNHSTANFNDPYRSLPQPSVVNSSQPLCAITGGTIPPGTTLGPYQYFPAKVVSGKYVWNTANPQLTVGNFSGQDSPVVFSSSSSNCPGTVVDSLGAPTTANPTATGFNTFTLWGGLNINGNSNTAVTFGAGQYVMAGTTSQTGAVFATSAATITGDSTHGGTMFVFTDSSYAGALTEPAVVSAAGTLYQGFPDIKNANMNLTGLTSAAPTLGTDYSNFLFWQDRRNSQDTLDTSNGDCASTGCHGTRPASVTDTSSQFVMESGNANLSMKGILYQPRGAWFDMVSGGTGAGGPLQLSMVTGAYIATGGNSAVQLAGPVAPITVYITALIQ